MRVFGPVVLAQALPMAGRKTDLRLGGAIEAALSHLPDLLFITGVRRGAGFNEINNSALLAKAQKPPLLA
jgi:preprotein translocase subunit SecA